jgi:N-acetylglucosaminyldiphosphoundecaprenol N-acetyl-beta-D-mannosaminyltransferase
LQSLEPVSRYRGDARVRLPVSTVSSQSHFHDTLETPFAGARRRDLKHARIMGLSIAAVTEEQAVAGVVDAALAGRSQWTITANLDHLRRYCCEPVARRLLDSADTVVADGAPLVWASRIAGTRLPQRVAGSDMVWSISDAASRSQVSIFLLGGNPGVAERAAEVLRTRFPDISICGTLCPPHGFDSDERQLELIERRIAGARPGIVLVALGFPKQDVLIERLRRNLPGTSLIGVGIGLSYVAGEMKRSPEWTRKIGLEWLHRLLSEPGRLVRRYLVRGMPFAIRLLGSAAGYRVRYSPQVMTGESTWGWDPDG